jgi:hypothetical protein
MSTAADVYMYALLHGWRSALPLALHVAQSPVRLQGWCDYDSRPYFRGPPTPLKSSLELPKFSLPNDTHHPLKTAGIPGFWTRYAQLETTHPQKSASSSQDPHLPTLLRILRSG